MAEARFAAARLLLAGLLRCGHCGRKLHVAYCGTDGDSGRYHCKARHVNHGGDRCISFGGMRVDRGWRRGDRAAAQAARCGGGI